MRIYKEGVLLDSWQLGWSEALWRNKRNNTNTPQIVRPPTRAVTKLREVFTIFAEGPYYGLVASLPLQQGEGSSRRGLLRNLVDTSTARQPNPATVLSMFARIILFSILTKYYN